MTARWVGPDGDALAVTLCGSMDARFKMICARGEGAPSFLLRLCCARLAGGVGAGARWRGRASQEHRWGKEG